MKKHLLVLLFSFASSNLYAASQLPAIDSSIEIISESDGTSDLSGFHFIKTFNDNASNFSGYFGGGAVYVSLPDENDEFPAIHAIAGVNYKLSSLLSLNAEAGFDLVEEIFSGDDRGDEFSNTEENNQIDYSVAVGLIFNLNKSVYIKTYYRHHVFDGIFLPETSVDFTGIRIGLMY